MSHPRPSAVRSLLTVILTAGVLSGCMATKTRCYLTLGTGGEPTAEACETGRHLVVRPITKTNAAYYVPPYVIGALRYEGFLGLADEIDAEEPPRDAPSDELSTEEQPVEADPYGQADLFDTTERMDTSRQSIEVPGGARRLAPKRTIDAEVRYRRPNAIGLDSFPLSNDLLL